MGPEEGESRLRELRLRASASDDGSLWSAYFRELERRRPAGAGAAHRACLDSLEAWRRTDDLDRDRLMTRILARLGGDARFLGWETRGLASTGRLSFAGRDWLLVPGHLPAPEATFQLAVRARPLLVAGRPLSDAPPAVALRRPDFFEIEWLCRLGILGGWGKLRDGFGDEVRDAPAGVDQGLLLQLRHEPGQSLVSQVLELTAAAALRLCIVDVRTIPGGDVARIASRLNSLADALRLEATGFATLGPADHAITQSLANWNSRELRNFASMEALCQILPAWNIAGPEALITPRLGPT